MRAKELQPLFGQLLPAMPGFVAHKSLLLMAPMHGLLRAVDFDSSAFDKFAFYPATVVMPLCVPHDHLSLLFGHRLRHRTLGCGWTMTMPDLVTDLSEAIRDQAIPFLSQASTLLDFVELAEPFSANPHAPREIAFALARAGEIERAIAAIDRYLPKLNSSVHWEKTMADQSMQLRKLLLEDQNAAQEQLSAWEDDTTRKLGLQSFR